MIFPGFLVNFQVFFSLFLKDGFEYKYASLLGFHLNKKLIISIKLQISKPSFLLQQFSEFCIV